MLGLVFCMLAELMDRKVRSSTDLLDALKAPVLGTIPLNHAKSRKFSLFNRALRNNLNSNKTI